MTKFQNPQQAIKFINEKIAELQKAHPSGKFVFDVKENYATENEDTFRCTVKCTGEDPAREPPEYYFHTLSKNCAEGTYMIIQFFAPTAPGADSLVGYVARNDEVMTLGVNIGDYTTETVDVTPSDF
ncbi:MAG: hypothetical protein E6R04_01255 [Spirochaetes bacterium]|nr:MAG: hypothetical protein E6R04_01255 [Spirochaetota bacterium]